MEDERRIIPPSRIGFAFGSGGTLIVFQVGAVEIFKDKLKLPPEDIVAIGVSGGAIVGASLVSENFSNERLVETFLSFKKKSDIFKRRVRPGSIYSLEKLDKIISKKIDFKKLIASPATFIATASEVPDDETVFFSSKDPEIISSPEIMKQAILASSAIEGIFPPVKINYGGKAKEFIDGAATIPLPLKKLMKLGCNTIIVIRCRSSKIRKPYPRTILNRWAYGKSLSLKKTEKAEINFIREHALWVNLFVIEPDWLPETLTPYSWGKGDFEKAMKHGREVAERELKPLLRYYGV